MCESDRSAPASADSTLPSKESTSGCASTTSTVRSFSTDSSQASPSTPTCENSEQIPLASMSSPPATPASLSATQGNDREKQTRDISGPRLPDALAYYDPDLHCWRTCQDTLDLDSTVFLPTLPRSGMTRNGWLYALPMSAHRTVANASSSLLPTPSASGDARNTKQTSDYAVLAQVVNLLPTPRAQNGEKRNSKAWARPLDQPQNIENAIARISSVAKLLPTPTARDFKGSGQNPEKHMREGRLTGIKHRNNQTGEFTKPQSDVGNTSSE